MTLGCREHIDGERTVRAHRFKGQAFPVETDQNKRWIERERTDSVGGRAYRLSG